MWFQAPWKSHSFTAGFTEPDLGGELRRLVELVEDDAVPSAPVDLQRHARERDRVDVRIRASLAVGVRHLRRRPAELEPRELPQRAAFPQPGEVAIAPGHVGGRVEGDRAGEQAGMLGDEQQCLLAAHRAADRVDAVGIDPNAEAPDDRRHARQVADLTRVAPGVLVQAPAFTAGIDDGEPSLARQIAPEARVARGAHPAAVRRDDERDRRAVVRGRQKQPGGAHAPVVRAVEEPQRPGQVTIVRRAVRGRRADEQRECEQGAANHFT